MEKKTETIRFNCTSEEYEAIKLASENAGLSMSDYLIRESDRHTELLSLIEKVTSNENKLDSDIDQMARKFDNQDQEIVEVDLQSFITQLQKVGESTESSNESLNKILKLLSE